MPKIDPDLPHNYYTILGVPTSASDEEIRQAARQQRIDNHPDRTEHQFGEEVFHWVCEAERELLDPARRKVLDQMLEVRRDLASHGRAFFPERMLPTSGS